MPNNEAANGNSQAPSESVNAVPATSGHKGMLELHVSYRAEAKPDSEAVKLFLNSLQGLAAAKTE